MWAIRLSIINLTWDLGFAQCKTLELIDKFPYISILWMNEFEFSVVKGGVNMNMIRSQSACVCMCLCEVSLVGVFNSALRLFLAAFRCLFSSFHSQSNAGLDPHPHYLKWSSAQRGSVLVSFSSSSSISFRFLSPPAPFLSLCLFQRAQLQYFAIQFAVSWKSER